MRSHSKTLERPSSSTKKAWTVSEWCADVGVGRSHLYDLLGAGKIKAVKSGKRTLVTTTPDEYLASLPAA
jgi:excisionase family DNA binding protein